MATTKQRDWRKFLVPEKEPLKPPRRRGKIIGYGPAELHLRENVIPAYGPEAFVLNNPQLFATGSTSRDEGYAYWALLKIIGPERVMGEMGMTWYYQSKVSGGATKKGGSIIDFLVEKSGPGDDLGIRIVTPYRHTQAGPLKVAQDFEQTFSLVDNDIFAVDVYSRNYINDKTGRTVILTMKRALESQPDYSPIYHRFMGV